MSDPYTSPFPDRSSGRRATSHAQYPDEHGDRYADQYGQYPEQSPTQAQPVVTGQPSTQYPSEHYSSQAYVTPQTPTRRSAGRFPESSSYDRDPDPQSRPAKKTGTPLGRIVLGVFLGMLLWTIVVGLIAVVLLAAVAGKVENRLQDLDNSVHTTSTRSTSE